MVRIPIGYLGFLLLAIALAWLLPRLGVERGRNGALVAGASGAVASGALLIGLWSISTASPGLLVAWWVGLTVEVGLGGVVIGSILGGARLVTTGRKVAALLVAGALSTIVLQAIGYAAGPVIIR